MADRSENNVGIIDINKPVSASILAGILGLTNAQVSEYRRVGRLPPEKDSTYKENIQWYVLYYKNKISAKSSSLLDTKMEQDIRLSKAREALQWLEVKKIKADLVDIKEMSELILPVFHLIRGNLLNLTRVFPETIPHVDKMLESLHSLGERIVKKAQEDGDNYVSEQLSKPVDFAQLEKEIDELYFEDENEIE